MDKVQELKEIQDLLVKYNEKHKDGCFVINAVGFKKDSEQKCVDCGGDGDIFDESKNIYGAYGDLDTVRMLINDLRDMAEDLIDENGFVNINSINED